MIGPAVPFLKALGLYWYFALSFFAIGDSGALRLSTLLLFPHLSWRSDSNTSTVFVYQAGFAAQTGVRPLFLVPQFTLHALSTSPVLLDYIVSLVSGFAVIPPLAALNTLKLSFSYIITPIIDP